MWLKSKTPKASERKRGPVPRRKLLAISGTSLPGGASTSAAGEQGMGFGGSSSTGAPSAMLDTG
ncbi:MAG TPA: hypothetical protein VND64_15300, partial [Pirellulales bacterium]|nr:hypothetical protein [Pirellulales bacterium]